MVFALAQAENSKLASSKKEDIDTLESERPEDSEKEKRSKERFEQSQSIHRALRDQERARLKVVPPPQSIPPKK